MKTPNHRFQVSFDYTPFTVPTPEIKALGAAGEKLLPQPAEEPYKDSAIYQERAATPDQKADTSGLSVNEIIEAMTGHASPTKKTRKKTIPASATPKLIEAFKALCKDERRAPANALGWLMTLAVENGKLDLAKRPAGNPWQWE